MKSLPRGATPVDFAYTIHSEVGEHTVGAKVNGKLVPVGYKLKNGDTVEILTSPHSHPSKDWLTFVKTSRAQARIRQFIRQAEHRRSIEIGREVAEREFRRFGVTLNKVHRDGTLDKAANALGYRIADDLLAGIGYGKVSPHDVLRQIVPPERLSDPRPEPEFGPLAPHRDLPEGGAAPGGGRRPDQRHRGRARPLPALLQPGAGRRDRRLHHPRSRRHLHTVQFDKVLGIDPDRRVDVSWDVKGT